MDRNLPVEFVMPKLEALNVERNEAQKKLNALRKSLADQTQDRVKLEEQQTMKDCW